MEVLVLFGFLAHYPTITALLLNLLQTKENNPSGTQVIVYLNLQQSTKFNLSTKCFHLTQNRELLNERLEKSITESYTSRVLSTKALDFFLSLFPFSWYPVIKVLRIRHSIYNSYYSVHVSVQLHQTEQKMQ